jgi:hypothetical protein
MADGGRLEGLLRDVLVELSAVEFDPADSADDDGLIELLRVGAAVERAVQRVGVQAVAALQRRGVFARLGQRPVTALADLLGVEHVEARRVVTAAEQVVPRADLQGQVLPARLPATAEAFAAGAASLRHVEVIARLMGGAAASRLTPDTRQSLEQQLAAQVGTYTPTVLRDWGATLLNLLDQDGARPDERDPREGNELRLTRDPHGGGWVKGRFTDAAMYDQIATLLDAKSAPLTADDQRPLEQRQAEAMAEIFGWVAAHGDTTVAPAAGGRRPQVNVLIRLEDLQNRAHAACLDHGGTLHPTELRRLCCDAGVIPIVLNGAGQPLDVGRQARAVPDGMRRAVTARDRGCAHPGCTRPPSWCEIHHIREWELGGDTALSNLVMLCLVHHREIHSSGWSVRIAADGPPEFIPPPWIDVEQKPRRDPAIPIPDIGRPLQPV